MADLFLYRCANCKNAIVDGHRPLEVRDCPACHHNEFDRISQVK